MDFEFDFEQADIVLEDAMNLLSVFWGFFAEERPLDGAKPDTTGALWFVQSCGTYESVLNAAWDKIRAIHADIEATIEKYYANKKKADKKKGGDAA